MNEIPSNPPGNPAPATPFVPPPPLTGARPLGEDPTEREPITNVFVALEALLRNPRRLLFQLRQQDAGKIIAMMLLSVIVCSAIYGLIVGSFSGGDQWWAAPAKVTSGLLVSALICLPSLYIFTGLSGSQARLIEILGLVSGLLLLMTVLLIGFAPVAWLFSQSTQSVPLMGFLHLIFWGVSTIFGLRFLLAGFAHARARSHSGLYTWVLIYLLVVLQMTTALRPLVGPANATFLPQEKKFFLSYWFEQLK